MSDQEDIQNQRELLATYRRTLATLLKQFATFGKAYAPPSIAEGIREAREGIRRAKQALRERNIPFEELPNDEDSSLETPNHIKREDMAHAESARRQGIVLDFSHGQKEWDRFLAFAKNSPLQFHLIEKDILSHKQEIDRSTGLVMAMPYHDLFTQVEIVSDPEGSSEYILGSPSTSAVMIPKGLQDPEGWIPAINEWVLDRKIEAPVLAACQHGKGKVIISGSWKICALDYADNIKLVKNIVEWLSEPSTKE